MITLAQIIPASLQAKEAAFLLHLTVEELETRLTKLETMGKKTAAELARGNRGEVEGTHIRKGQHAPTFSNEAALKRQRRAYAQTLCALKAKRAA